MVHKYRRLSESPVEIGVNGGEDVVATGGANLRRIILSLAILHIN